MRIPSPGRLEGERVVLRELAPADVEPYVRAFLEDPPLLVDVGADDAPSEREVRQMLKRSRERREDGTRLQLAMADPASDAFAGEIVLHHLDWTHHRAEIGFFVVREARRRGIALEAIGLLTRWAFDKLQIHRLQLMTLTENVATQRLAERAGFERDGVLRHYTLERGQWCDNVMYSRLVGDE